MFPVDDPRHNLFECAKQCVLLEAHLFSPEKRCPDCTSKHFTSAIGYTEELPTLDATGEYAALVEEILPSLYNLFQAWQQGADPVEVAQGVRRLRKHIMPHCVQCQPGAGVGLEQGSMANPLQCASCGGCHGT